MADKSERIHSASSLKRAETGSEQLQVLSPEGSAVYMTEVATDSWHDNHRHGNPITNKGTTLLGVPRKTSTQTPKFSSSATTHVADSQSSGKDMNLDLVTNGLSDLSVAHTDIVKKKSEDGECLSSTSSESDGEEDVLERAGVEGVDLSSIEAGPDGKAPFELLSQFVSCLMRNEYEAAILLCQKIVELEPHNETAAQFYPLIQERIKLDNELPTESSSSESEEEEESDDSSSDHSSSSESSEESSEQPTSAKGEQLNIPVDVSTPNPTHSHKHCTHTTTTWQP